MKEMSPTQHPFERGSVEQSSNCYRANNNSKILKRHRVLAAFCSGRSFTRFQAEIKLHDHCLHSTVSEIQKYYGITIEREVITVRGYKGNPTRCKRYWIKQSDITPASIKLANELVYHGIYKHENTAFMCMNELWQG